MQRKNLKLLIALIIIVLMVIFTYFYFDKTNDTTGDTTGDTSTGTNFVSDFFNFGVKDKTDGDTNEETPTDISDYTPPENTTEAQKLRLTKVSSMPVAGFTVFMKEIYKDVANPKKTNPSSAEFSSPPAKGGIEGGSKITPTAPATEFVPILRYVAKETGFIYQSAVDKILERKFTNTTIPRVYEASFADKENTVIMRYLKKDGKTIETFTGELPKEVLGADTAEENEITGSFLPENITDMSVSSDTSEIFYLFNFKDGVAGTTAFALGSNKTQVFDSKFTEWLSQWPNSNMITVTTKPASFVSGYMYAIDPNKKDLKKILGGINGLTTLTSPDGNNVLYSNNNLNMSIYNKQTGEYKQLGVRTLSEKCVWGRASDVVYCAVPKYINGSLYPDTWYQGEVSFSDDIWKIYTTDGNGSKILDPLISGEGTSTEEIDGIKLMLDQTENYLFFVNKKDSYLWELRLN